MDDKMKTCNSCGQTKPAARQYFHYDNCTNDGYKYRCIVCVAYYMKHDYIPSNEKPRLTAEEWAEKEADLAAYTLPSRLAAAAIKAKYASIGFVVDGIEYKIKVCSKCDTQKPATTDFFNRRASLKDGFVCWCKTCIKEFKALQRK